VRLQERLKRRFLTRHARSPPSPLEALANNEPTEPTPDGKVRAGEERNKDVGLPDVSPISPLVVHLHLNMMGYQCSASMTPGAAEQNEEKQREELADAETVPPNDASPTAEFDINEIRTFWTFLRARGKNPTTSPAQMTQDPSPKAVEVYAVRVRQVSFSYIACTFWFLGETDIPGICGTEAET
jgi:hypothetical protein